MYPLAHLSENKSSWDYATQMLYASTRNALTKALSSAIFTDSLFATSKADITPDAYEKHKKHMAAPKPLTAREQEMAEVRSAEGAAGLAMTAHFLGTVVGMPWSDEVQEAVKDLGRGQGSRLLVLVSNPNVISVVD